MKTLIFLPYFGKFNEYFEIGYDQAEAVSGILCAAGYEQIKVCKDYAGLDRVVSAVLV